MFLFQSKSKPKMTTNAVGIHFHRLSCQLYRFIVAPGPVELSTKTVYRPERYGIDLQYHSHLRDCLVRAPHGVQETRVSTLSSLRTGIARIAQERRSPSPSDPQHPRFYGELSTLGHGAHRFVAIAQWFVHFSTHPQPM